MAEDERLDSSVADTGDARHGWHDDPITSAEQDRFGRDRFAQHAARLINMNHSEDSSVVYGLEGPWGSGKSSAIALVTSHLATQNGRQWAVVPFTPWATAGTEALLEEFFAVLSSAAPGAERDREWRDKISSYAEISRPFTAVIPLVGPALTEATRTVERRLKKPWKVAFDEVAKEIHESEQPILVVVDDIDRLQPGELLDLLKVVRLLGRFPGVDFLLAYDEQTLVETLQDPSRGEVSISRARSFMEKIVQYPISLPPLLMGKIIKLLEVGLNEIAVPWESDSGFAHRRLDRILTTAMSSQLTTPRAIERFLAQVREQAFSHDPDEIDGVDLILATFLRVQFPDVFRRLQRWKVELTRSYQDWSTSSPIKETETNWEELLAGVAEGADRSDALEVLRELFPSMTSRNGSVPEPRRFAHPDYFDRYLAQGVPDGDILDVTITRALELAADGQPSDLRTLVLSDDDERAILAMNKISIRYPSAGEPWARVRVLDGPPPLDLLKVAMELADQIVDRVLSSRALKSQAIGWAASLLRLALEAQPEADVDPALCSCRSVHTRAHVLLVATGSLDELRGEVVEVLQNVLRREAKRLVPFLLDDLRRKDAADGETGSPLLYEVVIDAGLTSELRADVEAGLEAGQFTDADVAARFVGFWYPSGAVTGTPPSRAYFQGELFTKITGIEARSTDHGVEGVWPDTSLRRRREFASHYIGSAADGSLGDQD